MKTIKKYRWSLLSLVVVLTGLGMFASLPGGGASSLEASAAQPPLPISRLVYSVKFVCVPEVGPAAAADEAPFMPSLYRTAINLHNFRGRDLTFTKRAVVARSEDVERGLISDRVTETLKPDEALDIDCLDVKDLLGGAQPVGNGFVVIESRQDLDVVAVYTALFIEEKEVDRETVKSRVDENLELWNKIWFIVTVPPDLPIPQALEGLIAAGVIPIPPPLPTTVDSFFDVFVDVGRDFVEAADGSPSPLFPLGKQLVVKVPNFSGPPPPSGPGGKPGLGPKDPDKEVKGVLKEKIADDLKDMGVPPPIADQIAEDIVNGLDVEILDVDFGVGKGVGTGVGVGRGIGVGVGVGVSIDVEYIEPKRIAFGLSIRPSPGRP